jgi:hypothetical protein
MNEFEEPYAGKSKNLRKLVRLAGERVYSSPDYGWLTAADHWIEAIPLFIKEEVLLRDGQETTRTVVDIAGMEVSFREEMADLWALNLRQVLDSERLCLAREWLAVENIAGDPAEIAALGVLLGEIYRSQISQVQHLIEAEALAPFDALRQVLLDSELLKQAAEQRRISRSWTESARETLMALGNSQDFDQELSRLQPLALKPRRPLPTLHVLTTQSAGMTEGYIRTWLEESMALFNIAEDWGLHQEITQRMAFFSARILTLGEKIIRELGMWIEVEECVASESLPQAAAVARIINRNKIVQQELACLGALLEFAEINADHRRAEDCADPQAVEDCLVRDALALQEAALAQVVERNRQNLRRAGDHDEDALRRLVLEDEYYREDLQAYTRFAARHKVLDSLSNEYPQAHLKECRDTYLRRFQQLAKTTARKQIIAERGLNPLSLHPCYYFKATGGGKRYHLIYTPSRVDLGQRERESVESWSQWVGGADRAAAQAGRQIYSLINKDVRVFESLTEPEILKTGENASMVSHFAFSNALSLMVTASRHGDFEAMADLMNRRHDRLIHPAGEGYGGYCVPKDGLFLEFVLTLNRAEKLRQIGLAEAYHPAVIALANRLLDRKPEFPSQLEWEAWAASLLEREDCLRPYFTTSRGLPVFQITRIAQVLDNLGQPELRDPYQIASNLAAGWGLHKMVTGGEQVNRFMPFFKAWLIRLGVSEAARRHPHLSIAMENSVIVLTAEYKPDTQDARFSTGLRKFEILTGLGDHLLKALDRDGQIVATLMHEGFDALQKQDRAGRVLDMLDAHADAAEPMRRLFPATQPPAEIRLVAPTGLSTQDVLNYTSDTRLEAIADETRQALLSSGFTLKEIEANLRTWGTRLNQWDHRAKLNPLELAESQRRLAGRLHALALVSLGPERRYEYAAQGADVIDTGIPHQSLLELLADPARLCRLMLEGNPRSALVIVDGAAGARHRAMNRGDVMRWFAAGERLSREPVYLSVGLGLETVEAWRTDMRHQRARAERLWSSLTGDDPEKARRVYAGIVEEIRSTQEIQSAWAEADKLSRFGRSRERELRLCAALSRIGEGLPLAELGFAEFLALGGLYLHTGANEAEIRATLESFTSAMDLIRQFPNIDTPLCKRGAGGIDALVALLLPPSQHPAATEFRQQKGIESSNKAMEDSPTVALETRRQLAERIALARAQNLRQTGFAEVQAKVGEFDEHYRFAMRSLGPGDRPVGEQAFGLFLGHARNALLALAQALPETQGFVSRLEQLFTGRQIDEALCLRIAGGYEDIGDFGRLAQGIAERAANHEAKQDGLYQVAQGAELFSILLAVDCTTTLLHQESPSTDIMSIWRALAGFFAKTLNDHAYEYRPWLYSRGIGFADCQGEALYQLAVERHQWLYRYLRHILTHHTELKELSGHEQDLLLGHYLDGAEIEAIGAGADTQAEKIWRAYGQLRELAFIRNDGFPIPEVFPEFDPAIIQDTTRVNHIIAAPVGRTHFARMLREGPTLARQLEQADRRGANLIITRKIDIVEKPEYPRPMAIIDSGHFYLDAAAYEQALITHKGYSESEAARLAAQVPTKGIRVAARFTSPILAALVYPFHGNPVYTQGQLEACGLPYTVQSLFHTWTTYDKAKYRDMFTESGVELPDEMAWLAEYSTQIPDKATALDAILNGLPDSDYPGLLTFARRHALVMVKDAAESGGRNQQAFLLGRADGSLDQTQIQLALEFIYQISLKHNACIQEVIISSPEYWATEEFMRAFVHRQIVEWGSAVNRQRQPKTPIFGSHRIIVSTDNPTEADSVKKWHISHWITLNSKQIITNVGRGGTLEQFLPEFIRPEYRQTILTKLADAGRCVMEAMTAYEARGAEQYTAETGRIVGTDLTGVSYGLPRYLMLDFLISPVLSETGIPGDWRVVLIEPNIGVGLWDRLALREENHELQQAMAEHRNPEWNLIGENARIVLADLNRAGEEYLHALTGNHDGLS